MHVLELGIKLGLVTNNAKAALVVEGCLAHKSCRPLKMVATVAHCEIFLRPGLAWLHCSESEFS